jgi:hypothetical protein
MATYYLKVPNEDSVEYDSVTPPMPLASVKESGYLFKYGSKRWRDLHVIILYTAIAVLSVTVGSLLLRGSIDRDIGTLFSMLPRSKWSVSADKFSSGKRSC